MTSCKGRLPFRTADTKKPSSFCLEACILNILYWMAFCAIPITSMQPTTRYHTPLVCFVYTPSRASFGTSGHHTGVVHVCCYSAPCAYVSFLLYVMDISLARVRNHGLVVVEGDLVIEGGADSGDTIVDDEDALIEEVEVHGPMNANRDHQVRLVTAEDVAAGRYAVTDVVLPLPSHDSMWPTHSTGNFMLSLLEENGITQDMFDGQKGRLGGAYRRVLVIPQDMTWRCQTYISPNDDIQQTELNIFRDANTSFSAPSSFTEGGEADHKKKFLAAVIEFSLPSGTYATMLLRELMKSATDSTHHASMTAANAAELEAEESSKHSDDERSAALPVDANDVSVSRKQPLELEVSVSMGDAESMSPEKRQRC